MTYGVLVVPSGLLVLGTGVPLTDGEPVGVTVVVGDGVSDGVVLVTVGAGDLVDFFVCVCVGDGVGLGVVVCAGMTMTRGGGGGRTSR